MHVELIITTLHTQRVATDLEVECDNRTKYPCHGFIVEFVDGDDIEVPQEARCDGVTPTTWGAHGSQELDINQRQFASILLIIPVVGSACI